MSSIRMLKHYVLFIFVGSFYKVLKREVAVKCGY